MFEFRPTREQIDVEDELQTFSVELMENLLSHFTDSTCSLMPQLHMPSTYYSDTILKGAALAWRLTSAQLAQMFWTDFPFMNKSSHELFSYAKRKAAELYDDMYPHAQLIHLAAFCFEFFLFLSRNGLRHYLYLSYTLFYTLWRERYEENFNLIGGWDFVESALAPYKIVYQPLHELFVHEYQFDYDDMGKVLKEFEIVMIRSQTPSRVPIQNEIRNLFGDLSRRKRTRLVTPEDWKIHYLAYVTNFEALRFINVGSLFPPDKLLLYIRYREMLDGRYGGRAALLELYRLEDMESHIGIPPVEDPEPGILPMEDPEDLTRKSQQDDELAESCRRSLHSVSIQDTQDSDSKDTSDGKSVKDIAMEKGLLATAEVLKAEPTECDKEQKTPEKGSDEVSTTVSRTPPPKRKVKLEVDDEAKTTERPETLEFPEAEPGGGSESGKDESPTKAKMPRYCDSIWKEPPATAEVSKAEPTECDKEQKTPEKESDEVLANVSRTPPPKRKVKLETDDEAKTAERPETMEFPEAEPAGGSKSGEEGSPSKAKRSRQ